MEHHNERNCLPLVSTGDIEFIPSTPILTRKNSLLELPHSLGWIGEETPNESHAADTDKNALSDTTLPEDL
jgi:hypothetical protein